MKVALPALLAVALFPSIAFAAAKCDRCRDLPMLEQQLFQQEWLQREFREYAEYRKHVTPTAEEKKYQGGDVLALQREVTASFNKWLKSPAGGGGGAGGAELGTAKDCKLVLYVKDAKGNNVMKNGEPVTKPFDDAAQKKYRDDNCPAIADYLLAHEKKHQKSCADAMDFDDAVIYAADDVRAYGAGVKNLRDSIAKLAEECGWEGSSHKTKKTSDGSEETTVPTMKQIKSLSNALKAGAAK